MSGATRNARAGFSPTTGRATTNYDANAAGAAAAMRFMIDVYVPTDVQESLISNLQAFSEACLGLRGVPLPGRALAAVSQSGKSKAISEFARRMNALEPVNPRRVLHVELSERITLKMLYQRILAKAGDPEAFGRYNVELLRQRCAELLPQAGTQLLAIDEVQLVCKLTKDNYEVADGLKSMLDDGVVAILFAGNEKAREIFDVNEQLRGRLGVPLELGAANPKIVAEQEAFRAFAKGLDEAIANSQLVGLSGLNKNAIFRPLGKAAGGHIGRFCRIVGAALEHACARGAGHIEPFDLSYAVRHLAIPATWVAKNPFPEPETW